MDNENRCQTADLEKFVEVLGFNIKDIVTGVVPFLTNLVFAAVIFYVGKWLVKKVVQLVEALMVKSKVDATLVGFAGNVLYGLLLVLVVITALSKLGVNTTSAVALLGGAALAVGMALQGQLSNFAAGVMLIVFRPFKVGDFVRIDDKEGAIKEIHIINTELVTLDNHTVIIPNANITTNAIINYTAKPTRRVNLTVGIGYTADIKKAREIMLACAADHARVLGEPKPAVKMTNLGDNSVDMTLLAWTKTPDWLGATLDLRESIKLGFDEAGIEIPFPQRSVYVTGLKESLEQMGK